MFCLQFAHSIVNCSHNTVGRIVQGIYITFFCLRFRQSDNARNSSMHSIFSSLISIGFIYWLVIQSEWEYMWHTHTHTFRRSWKYFQLSNPEQCSVPESDIIWNADRNLFCQRINTRIHKWIYKKWKRHSFVRRFYRILRYSLAQKNIRINSKNSFKINFNFFLFFLPNNKCHTGKAAKIPQWKILSVIWPDDDEDAWQCI